MRVIFLGTGGSIPTPRRGLPAILVQRENEHLMFDCGEGVQRQMITGKCGFHKPMKIFITHMHGDHMLGLPGLMQTMALLDRQRPLDIYGPVGIGGFLQHVKETVQFALTYPVQIHEITKAGLVCREEEYMVHAAKSNHVITSFAYSFIEKDRPGRFHPEKAKGLSVPEGELWSRLQHGQEIRLANGRMVKPEEVMDPPRPGRKIVYTGDTRPFKNLGKFAAMADLIIHDATLDDELLERAKRDGHSTPSQAALDAEKSNAKQLVLTHISARYTRTNKLLKEARKIFKNTIIAEDYMKIELPPH